MAWSVWESTTLAYIFVSKSRPPRDCCDWRCMEYVSVYYCVLLLFLLKFQVLKFAECYVRMWLIERFVCVLFRRDFCAVVCQDIFKWVLCTEAFFTEAMFSREFLLSRHYARGVEAGQLDLSSSMFCDLRPRKRGRRGRVRLRARRRKYRLPLPSIVFGNA